MSDEHDWRKRPASRDNLLMMLHDAQDAHGTTNHVPSADRSGIAERLGLSPAEVDGVMSFYTMLSPSPRGRYVLRLCDSLSCRISGSLDVYRRVRERLGIREGETTADGLFSLEIVNCVGSCATAPNLMVNDTLHTSVTPERVDELLAALAEEACS